MTNIKGVAVLLTAFLIISMCYIELASSRNISALAISSSSSGNPSPSNSIVAVSNISQYWNFTITGETPKSPPVVSNGYLYAEFSGDNAYAYCLNAINGNQVWNFNIGKTTGVAFSPVISNGYVYVGASIVEGNISNYFPGTFPSSQVVGTVYCLNTTTGIQAWNYSTGPNSFVVLSPVIGNGNIYLISGNPAPANICALNAFSGKTIWNITLTGLTEPIDSSAPVLAGNTIFAGLGNFVFALDASNGNQLWNYTAANSVGSVEIANGVIYFGSGNPVCAVDEKTGAKLWSATTEGIVSASPPIVSDGAVYVSSGEDIYSFNVSKGIKLWNYTTGGQTSPPTLSEGSVYFGCSDLNVYCLNASSGANLWQYAINSPQLKEESLSNVSTLAFSPVIENKIVYISLSLTYVKSNGENVPIGTTVAIGQPNNSAMTATSSSPTTNLLSNQNLDLIGFVTIIIAISVILGVLLVFRIRKRQNLS